MRVVIKQSPEGKKIEDAIKKLSENKKFAKVGWFEGAKYDDGTPVAYVAAINEYGVLQKNIPARPMLGATINKKSGRWKGIIKILSRQVINGKITVDDMLEQIGLIGAGDVRETITQLVSPPLKPATIKARLNKLSNKTIIGNLTKPLVETKLLLNSVSNKVDDKP